jgi:hypothetical protein
MVRFAAMMAFYPASQISVFAACLRQATPNVDGGLEALNSFLRFCSTENTGSMSPHLLHRAIG